MEFYNIIEHKIKKDRLEDVIEWKSFVAPGVILNRDESFMRIYAYRGKDLNSCTEDEVMVNASRLNNIFKRLDDNWVIYAEAVRQQTEPYPEREFLDPLSATIDKERELDFNAGSYFETKYFLTIQYLPNHTKTKSFIKNLIESIYIKKDEVIRDIDKEFKEDLHNFIAESDHIMSLFAANVEYCRPLTDDETATYLHNCISNRPHRVCLGNIKVLLNQILTDTPLVAGFEPRLGHDVDPERQHLGVVCVKYMPEALIPCVLDILNNLGFEYRWVTRFLFCSKETSKNKLESYRTEFNRSQKPVKVRIQESFSQEDIPVYNEDAIAGIQEITEALRQLGTDEVGFGYLSMSIVIRDKDKKMLSKKIEQARRAIEIMGFTTITENQNSVDAWLGSLPGHARWQPRHLMSSTLYLAYTFPLSSVWAGYKHNKIMQTPPLMITQTDSTTPFCLNLHVGDVGHTMIVGPTGAGKSVLLNTLAIQTRGVPNSQVFIFDQGGSSRCTTAGVGGTFFDIGKETKNSLSFQPLGEIDTDEDISMANEWVKALYANQGLKLTPEEQNDIWTTILKIRNYPKELRRLKLFKKLVSSEKLKESIIPYTEDGPYGKILDTADEAISNNRWQVFETEILLRDMKDAIEPILFHLFHKIEKMCNGPWTYIIFDESWAYLKNAYFLGWLEEFLRKARKKHVSVIFATQDLTEIGNSSISNLVASNCKTKIYLPNSQALSEQVYPIYRGMGLNDREIRLIAEGIPKQQYYYKSELGSRMFNLALTPFALSFVGTSSPGEQMMVKNFLDEHPDEDFAEYWIRSHGFMDALNYYDEIRDQLEAREM